MTFFCETHTHTHTHTNTTLHSALFHNVGGNDHKSPSIHLVHYIAHLLKSMMLWLKCNTLFAEKSLRSHYSRQWTVPLRASVWLQKSWSPAYEICGCLLLYFPELTALLHIMKNTLRTSHTHTHTPALLRRKTVKPWQDFHLWLNYSCSSGASRSDSECGFTRVWAKPSEIMHETMKIFSVSTPHELHEPKPAGHRRLFSR